MQRDLSIEDVLSDPLIALLRRADGISTPEFTSLLLAASQTYTAVKPSKMRSAQRGDVSATLTSSDAFDVDLQQDIARIKAVPKAGASCIGW